MAKISQKSLQVVKHVVKGEKWACSTLEAGKNKPVVVIAKTRDFARMCEEIKVSDKTYELIFARDVRFKWWNWAISAQMIGVRGANTKKFGIY